MKYTLEIYEPGSTLDVLMTFDAKSPFVAISKGDILNPAFFHSYDNNPAKVLVVTNIEHILWQHEGADEPTQKILIFTIEKDNNAELRGRS